MRSRNSQGRPSIAHRPTVRCSITSLYADLKTYLVELLKKQDQMSMAASIESRVPFLDHHYRVRLFAPGSQTVGIHDQADPA